MIAFIDDHRGAYGVEPICRVLKIAPSTYHAHDARRRRPDTAPPRVRRDAALSVEIRRVFDENFRLFCCLSMAPSSQELEPPANPGRFSFGIPP